MNSFNYFSSGSIELTSLLAVDAHIVESGVKVAATLHSSTGLDLTVKVLEGYGVDVKIGLPVKKQEILNFNSDVVSIVREMKGQEVESPIKFDVQRCVSNKFVYLVYKALYFKVVLVFVKNDFILHFHSRRDKR